MAEYPALTEQAGITTQIAAPDLLQTGAGIVTSGGLITTGYTTAAMTGGAGQFGYNSAASTMTPTDNATAAKSRVVGAFTGTAGEMQNAGIVSAAQFTTAGGSPGLGAPVYLANAADEAAAVGKLTATAPIAAGKVVSEVGICLDNANYAGAKTAKILLQPKSIVQL